MILTVKQQTNYRSKWSEVAGLHFTDDRRHIVPLQYFTEIVLTFHSVNKIRFVLRPNLSLVCALFYKIQILTLLNFIFEFSYPLKIFCNFLFGSQIIFCHNQLEMLKLLSKLMGNGESKVQNGKMLELEKTTESLIILIHSRGFIMFEWKKSICSNLIIFWNVSPRKPRIAHSRKCREKAAKVL